MRGDLEMNEKNTNFDVYEFSKRLNLLLEERKLRINELSERTGLSRKQISLYKNLINKKSDDFVPPKITISTIMKIAQGLDTTTDYLLGMSTVASNNLTVTPIMENLGLSEKSINVIISNKGKSISRNGYTYKDPQSDILNLLFESELYYDFILHLHKFNYFGLEFQGKKLDGLVSFADGTNGAALGIITLRDYKLFLKNSIGEYFDEMSIKHLVERAWNIKK